MKLPKYISLRSGTYHYQRDYPTKLKHLCHTKAYTKPLGLFANNAKEDQITKAAIEAGEAFDRQLILITNSDPDALSATDKDKAVIEFLRKRGLNKGQYLRVKKDAAISMQEQQMADEVRTLLTDGGIERAVAKDLSYQSFTDEALHADWAVPEFEDVLEKQQRGEKLSLKDTIVGDAWLSLVNKQEAKPKTLGSLWAEYAKKKDMDVNSRDGKKYTKYWQRWLEIAGDVIIGPLTLDHIHEGLDLYNSIREGQVKSSSIYRELATIVACLNAASKKYRFNWKIELPEVKKTPIKSRHPLEPHQQKELVKAVLTQDGIKPQHGVIILLCLQGGMMVSEIKRLLPEDIALDAVVPHLKIVNETKNEDRKRILPIVLGLDLLKAHLETTVKWLKNTTDTGPSYAVKLAMRRTVDAPATSPHCLRHTFKINGQSAGVSVLTIASIAGWKDTQRKLSEHLLNYGSTGISQDAMVIKLKDDSMIIHKELIALEQSLKADSNVLAFAAQGF